MTYLPQKPPVPGPPKKFRQYFTIPIPKATKDGFEKVKWRLRMDKTEIARRVLDYFLTMPPETQDKIVKSFDGEREKLFKRTNPEAYQPKLSKPKLTTVASLPNRGAVAPQPKQIPLTAPKKNIFDGLP